MSRHVVGVNYNPSPYPDLGKEFIQSLRHFLDCKDIVILDGPPLRVMSEANLIVGRLNTRLKTSSLIKSRWSVYKNRFGPANIVLGLDERQALFDRYAFLARYALDIERAHSILLA